jgi:hypothetical protein
MQTFMAWRRRQGAPVLLGALGLSAVAVPAAAQEVQFEVDCGDEAFIDHDGDLVYFLTAGEALECTVTGLGTDTDEDATWGADFYDMEADDDAPVAEYVDEPLTVDDEGSATFAIPVPAEPPALWMVALVEQGDLEVVFYGSTVWEGVLDCEPQPVTEGEAVTCTAEELLEEEAFWWWVVLYDAESEEVRELTGEGTADADGIGVFTFEVPAGEGIASYEASAEQDLYAAWFDGDVEAAEDPAPKPSPSPTATPAPSPTPSPVPQPTRVDTGMGGTASTDGLPLLLLGALALGGLVLHAGRRVTR